MRELVAGLSVFSLFCLVWVGVFHRVNISRRALALVVLWIVGLPVHAWFYAWLPDDRAVWPAVLAAPSDRIMVLSGGLLYFPSSCAMRSSYTWPRVPSESGL